MENRFLNIFPGLSEERAIELLYTPMDQLEDASERYIAAAHLVNFPSARAIDALLAAVENGDSPLDNRIVRRKAVETLGRLKVERSLPVICACLQDEDHYLVENAAWAIGEIGCNDPEILEELTALLAKPRQSYRTIIQTLAKLGYTPATGRIAAFEQSPEPPIASAAITAVGRLSGERAGLERLLPFLQHPNVNARRGVIQDLMDSEYCEAIPRIAACPVSAVFRLRGIRHLADAGVPTGAVSFEQVESSLDRVIVDHPRFLEPVHRYERTPRLEELIEELYSTDFGRCYLATQTIIDYYPDAGPALVASFEAAGHNDYGAHYHIVKLLGWLRFGEAREIVVGALHDRRPQFMKSRSAAAVALAELGDARVLADLHSCLDSFIWELKYACLIALEHLEDPTGAQIALQDADWVVRAKAERQCTAPLAH
ncbi:MAG: HEAT repeat domain-containing protein [Aphanocapsa lilacina HA4352-LM1]|jgi:bilin biosynthesis protein|nr:HEAT repeat domain-containing protein [Aphanocapsa lilacina HA4352-LM1]